jgi:alkanesulfonate monooxygenase SsuD/methylene tetrahydromethanopterin reductase-like flavin-dependent oxidoreductase (luciferase family)
VAANVDKALVRRGFAIPATEDLERAQEIAARVEELGYSSIWSNDTPGADGIVTAAAMADATGRLRVGVGVVAVHRRSPQEIADVVRELEIPLERLVLGVGSGSSPTPIRTVREAVAALRDLLGPDLQVGVAAMGPQMCRLAGEVADTVLFNWMVPERIQWAKARVAQGAKRAGRYGLPELASYVRCATGEGAVDRVAAEAAKYNGYPAYTRHFTAMGVPLAGVGVTDQSGDYTSRLADYDSVLDEVVVRALPESESVTSTLAVAEASAPVNRT